MEADNLTFWWKAHNVFERALECAADELPDLLKKACGEDEALRKRVLELLEAHRASGDFLELGIAPELLASPKSSADPSAAAPPQSVDDPFGLDGLHTAARSNDLKIGEYRLVKTIGRGGMGTVFLAEGPFHPKVAIKIIRSGPNPSEITHRFLLERHILGRLEHPGIAHLIDGGITDDGHPYFVMEYVDGSPITEYCDTRSLSIEERLTLFQSVCQAVHVAHQHLIVHRDLKPGNILVTDDGHVKLLDFGIAKMLEPAASGHEMPITAMDVRVLTPEYAAPEQLQGRSITTVTDVYQLGILLYELLTGRRPFQAVDRSLSSTVQSVCEQEPQSASTAVSSQSDPIQTAARRGLTPDKLTRRLRGDIDVILSTALRIAPERRYATAAQFSDDVRRHLAGLPIAARKDTWRYRTSKFIGRNRLAVTAASLVAAALAVGLGMSLHQAERARAAQLKAERTSTFLLETLLSADPSREIGIHVTVVDLLLYAENKAERELGDVPDLQAPVLSAVGVAYKSIGLLDHAERSLSKALALLEGYPGANRREQAAVLDALGDLARTRGDYEKAERLYLDALELRNGLYGDEDAEVAFSLELLAALYVDWGRFDDGERTARQALELRRKSTNPETMDLAMSLYIMAGVLASRGRPDSARPLVEEARAIVDRLDDRHARHAVTGPANMGSRPALTVTGLDNLIAQLNNAPGGDASLIGGQMFLPRASTGGDSPTSEYGHCGPGALREPKALQVVNAGRDLTDVWKIEVIECRSADGEAGAKTVECPPDSRYTFCILNEDDGKGNYVRLGVTTSPGAFPFGYYGRCSPEAGFMQKAAGVRQIGRSLDGVSAIDVLDCRGYDGPGGYRVTDCPDRTSYAYCLLNQNDGVGNRVLLGVAESDRSRSDS